MWKIFTISIDRLKCSEITQNIATLSIGSVISQFIPIVMSFVLSRLYSVENYGDFSIFINYAGIIAVFSSFRYEYAIVRPRKEVDALNLFALSGIIALATSFLLWMVLLLSDLFQIAAINSIPLKYWLPIYTISIALVQIFNNYANRIERYRTITFSAITKSVSQAITRICFGFFHYGPGLIIGSTFGLISSCSIFFRKIPVWHSLMRSFSWKRMCSLAKTYTNFPKYVLPSGLLNTMSTNLPVILLAYFYTKDNIGHFSMAISILYLPITVIGNALGQIFYKKASSWEKDETNTLAKQFLTLSAIIGLFIFVVLFLGGEQLFSFLLGENWALVGRYATFLSPWLISVLCLSPLGWIFDARDKQKTEMYINVFMFCSRIFIILLGGFLHLEFGTTLILYSLISLILWLIEGSFIYKILEIQFSRSQKIIISSYICLILLGWIVRIW